MIPLINRLGFLERSLRTLFIMLFIQMKLTIGLKMGVFTCQEKQEMIMSDFVLIVGVFLETVPRISHIIGI
jgi:hypothetical protein